jgi:hypothetical protein
MLSDLGGCENQSMLLRCPRRLVFSGRTYATISSVSPDRQSTEHSRTRAAPPFGLNARLLASLSASRLEASLRDVVHQYVEQSGCVLTSSLPYESRPSGNRRPTFDNGDQVMMITHCVQDATGKHEVTVSSGFGLAAPGEPDKGPLILTCAHTLEEARMWQVQPCQG